MAFHHNLPGLMVTTVATAALAFDLSAPAQALTGQEVNDISREVTVFIAKGEDSNGSGVIISRDRDTYYVLTGRHVVKDLQDNDGEIEYSILTHEQKVHEIEFTEDVVHLDHRLDLAIVKFESDEDYETVTLIEDSDTVTPGTAVFVSGWPMAGSIGTNSGQSIRQFTYGRISTVLEPDVTLEGYQLGYSNDTFVGMSGGPVLDAGGRLVAIHGQADTLAGVNLNGAISLQSPSGQTPQDSRNEIARQAMANLDFNFGIPTNTVREALAASPLAGLDIEYDSAPSPELGAPYVASAEPDPRDVISDINSVFDTVGRGLSLVCGVARIFGGC